MRLILPWFRMIRSLSKRDWFAGNTLQDGIQVVVSQWPARTDWKDFKWKNSLSENLYWKPDGYIDSAWKKRPWSDTKISNWRLPLSYQSLFSNPFFRNLWKRWIKNLHDDTHFNELNTSRVDRDQALEIAIRGEQRDFTEMNGEVAVGCLSGTSGHRGVLSPQKRKKYVGCSDSSQDATERKNCL